MLFPLAVKIIALANLSNIMNLHLMEDFAESHGAVCLDGSPGVSAWFCLIYHPPSLQPTYTSSDCNIVTK